jgi:hypothetical protein
MLFAGDAWGRPIVSVHIKRTFRIRDDGTCELIAEQMPFLNLPSEESSEDEEVALPEVDILPHKASTDLIVMASAHAPGGRPATSMVASIAVGKTLLEYLVQGDRRCLYGGAGSIRFSQPEPFTRIPLRYEYAYGGADPTVEVPPPANAVEALSPHPGIYPRNPAGRGYVVNDTPSLLDGLLLPNVEHPRDPITPRRLVTGSVKRWWMQPRPWSCDWFDATWFPRSVFLGAVPDHLPEDDRELAEVRSGYLEAGLNRRHAEASIEDLVDLRCGDAASPSLVLPFMRGDEAIRFRGMTPSGNLVVRLPGQAPKVFVRFRGRAEQLKPVPNRILVSLEERGVYIVWHAPWVAPEALLSAEPDHTAPHDNPAARGVEAVADGRPVASLP